MFKCKTNACWKEVFRTGAWKQTLQCKYAPGYCLECMQPYWIIGSFPTSVMDRKLEESFDRRTKRR